jgi:hypothetical protein
MMTIEEHTLVTGMFARQAQQIKALFEILKSRGTMQGDDEAALKDLVSQGRERAARNRDIH